MLDVENGAQQDRFAAGTQQIADTAAAELGDRVVLQAAVRNIDSHDHGVIVTSETGSAHAEFVIVAIPPEHWSAIEFSPALSAEHRQLPAQWPQGRLSKAYVAYATPFWRAQGFSGESLSDEGPVFITFDVSPQPDGPGILLGFVDSREFDKLPAEHRIVRRPSADAARLRRPSLGRRRIRPRWPHSGGAARRVDPLRTVAAPPGRAYSLGRN
jgi:monoamine oxidase